MLALNSMNRSINQAADELGRVHAELHRDIIRRGRDPATGRPTQLAGFAQCWVSFPLTTRYSG